MPTIARLLEYIEVNPKEVLSKGTVARKISMDKLQPFCRDIPEYELAEFSGGTKFRNGDTIMARITPCLENGKTAMVNILAPGEVGFGSTEFIVFRAKAGFTDPNFVYYLIISSIVRGPAVKSMVGSSGRQRVQTDVIQNLEVVFPELSDQKKIAGILKTIDDRIALNNKINENLQQQMQALFADWLSANSEYATEVALGDICSKVTDGSHFSPKDDPTSSIPMLSVKDMREFDFDLTSCKHICEDDYDKMVVNDCVPQVNDILVAKDGSYLKEIFICNEQRKLAILSSIAIFRPNTTVIHPEILLAFLKSPRVLQEVRDNYVSGSALPRIVLKDFKKLVLTLPDMDTQKLIAPLFTSIREQIAVNVAQNKYLTQLRDALLPKLMSGELNVDNIQL